MERKGSALENSAHTARILLDKILLFQQQQNHDDNNSDIHA